MQNVTKKHGHQRIWHMYISLSNASTRYADRPKHPLVKDILAYMLNPTYSYIFAQRVFNANNSIYSSYIYAFNLHLFMSSAVVHRDFPRYRSHFICTDVRMDVQNEVLLTLRASWSCRGWTFHREVDFGLHAAYDERVVNVFYLKTISYLYLITHTHMCVRNVPRLVQCPPRLWNHIVDRSDVSHE